MSRYQAPDPFEHVYAFMTTEAHADELADYLNREGVTGRSKRHKKWVAGTFHVTWIEGRGVPAVVGDLTGN